MSPANASENLYYAVWATAWGPMGAAVGPAGLREIVLPHYQFDQIEELLLWHHSGSTRDEAHFEAFIRLSRDYFNGRRVDFDSLACDLPPEGTFKGKVLRACRSIAYGLTCNYGRLAEQIARPDSARAVATALAKNPLPLVVPCHRVIYADGRAGGFSAPGGVELKKRMLQLERRGGQRS